MQDTVVIDSNNIIVIAAAGPQTEANILNMGEEIKGCVTRLQVEHKPILVLDDITELGYVPPAGRKAVVTLGKTLKYDKLAMVGKPGSLLRISANLLLSAMGRAGSTKYFDDHQSAVNWLLEPVTT